jgi:hypothetical protein
MIDCDPTIILKTRHDRLVELVIGTQSSLNDPILFSKYIVFSKKKLIDQLKKMKHWREKDQKWEKENRSDF